MSVRSTLPYAFTVAMIAAGLALHAPQVHAQAPQGKPGAEAAATEDGAKRNWLVTCSDDAPGGGSQCRMVQSLAVKKTGQRLLTIVIQKEQSAEQPRLVVGLPHGVYFPEGVKVSVDDGEATTVAVQTSDANGAYAMTDIDDALLAAMRKGAELKVAFQSGNRQPITIPVSLDGFVESYQRVASFGG